ncbi:MAG: YihY/virulence factor BrkB family protein [Microvirga sp.]
MAVATAGSHRTARSGPKTNLSTLLMGLVLSRLAAARNRPQAGPGDRPRAATAGAGADRSRRVDETGKSPRPGAKKDALSLKGAEAEQAAANEPDRGRTAETPSQIPAKGWKDILWRVYAQIGEDRVLSVAAGVTFYALLALFPGITAFVSLYGLFADAGTVSDHLAKLSGILPSGALDIIGEQVRRIASKPAGSLGFAFFSGLAIALWSSNAGMKALFDALNIVYDEDEKRGFIKLNAISLLFTLGALVFLLLALAAVVAIPVVLKLFWFGKTLEWLLSILRWPILLIGVLFGLACLYRYGPSRDKAQWRWVTWGSAIAAALWLGGSMLFSWYVANFGNYDATYGSLGAAIGFMTWIWLSTIVILLGGEINAELEHQTAEDTTEGARQPLGTRGAKMADTVGAAA